jgi:hypothetical protein
LAIALFTFFLGAAGALFLHVVTLAVRGVFHLVAGSTLRFAIGSTLRFAIASTLRFAIHAALRCAVATALLGLTITAASVFATGSVTSGVHSIGAAGQVLRALVLALAGLTSWAAIALAGLSALVLTSISALEFDIFVAAVFITAWVGFVHAHRVIGAASLLRVLIRFVVCHESTLLFWFSLA